MPWLNVWIMAGMVHDLWLIGRGFKDPLARGLEAAVDGFGGLVLLRIVADGPSTVLDVAFKPVIAIVAVIVLVSSAVDAVGAARTARDNRLAAPDASRP